jgi:hypothetical protein
MYFRYQNKAQILVVEDNFAHLRLIDELGNLHFRFTYSVSQKQVVSYRALKVNTKIVARTVARKNVLQQSTKGYVDAQSIVDNVLTMVTDAKTTVDQQTVYVLASKLSDISSKINNQIVPQLLAQAPVSEIPSLNRPKLTLSSALQTKQANDPQPILHTVIVPDIQGLLSASLIEEPTTLMHRMIVQQGQDPSQILNLTPRASPEAATHGGLSNTQRAQETKTDPAPRLLNYHLFPPSSLAPPTTTDNLVDTELVQILTSTPDDQIEIVVPLGIPVGKLNLEGAPLTQVQVVFELLDPDSGMAIDSATKLLDITQHVQVYRTPKVPPTVKLSASEVSSKVNLEVKQLDPGATTVDVYKKSFWISTPEVDDYTLIGTYPLTTMDQSLLVQVDRPTSSPALYRVIPKGSQSLQGFEYTNVVVKPAHYTPVKSISLTALQVDTGIQLEVRQFPTNVVAVRFLRVDLSIFESDPETVGDDVGFIDDATREADLLVLIDTDVTYDHVYQYTVELIYIDGDVNPAGAATIEFVNPSPGEVDTEITDLKVVTDTTPNVSFTVTTTVVGTDLDAFKQMLDNQGLSSYFTGDIEAQRDQLTRLIAHQIHRIDLNTGLLENFGTITVPNFDDESLRKNQSIAALQYGHRYRYVIYPLLRQPETLFDSFVKTATDPITKKVYTFSPAKFLHPLTLNKGVIVTSKGAVLRYAKDPMAHGVIGSITSTEVSFDQETATITEAVAANFDRQLNLVTWRLTGDITQVDHFLIMKQVHGIRTAIGKAHSEFTNGSCQYIHKITSSDVGALQFVIVPIYSDYKVGSPTVTNTLVVEAP